MALQHESVPRRADARQNYRVTAPRAPAQHGETAGASVSGHDSADRGPVSGAPLGPARGLVLGLAIGLVLWAALLALAWWLLRG
jgi:hypothetical protein